MRIAFFTIEYPTKKSPQGGLANYLANMSKLLADRGHDSTIFFLSCRNKVHKLEHTTVYEVDNYQKYFEPILKIPIIRIPFRIFITTLLNPWCLNKAFRKENRRRPHDLIQVPILAYTGFLGLFSAFSQKIPIIGRFSYYPKVYYRFMGTKNSFLACYFNMLEQFQIKKLHGLFAPCRLTANLVSNHEKRHINVIYSPILKKLPDRHDKRFSSINTPNQFLLYFNQFEYFKGIDILANAIIEIFKAYNDIFVLLIGENKSCSIKGYTTWLDYIYRKAPSKIHKRIIHSPPIPKDQLFQLIQKSTAVLMPSRVDNYPNACLEAQSLGAIVIATENSSLEEMIIDGKTGYLAKNGDPISFKNKIEHVLHLQPQDREKMRNNIINISMERAKEDRIGCFIEYYENIIKNYRSIHQH